MRAAILGCGSIGRRHARNLLTLGAADPILYEPQAETRAAVEAELGLPVESRLEAVWQAAPQLAIIAAPTAHHLPLAEEALRHGCHLFVEKPLAHTLAGVDALCREAEQLGRVTMVACNMRFHPGPATVRRLLAERAVGAVLSARIQAGSYLPRWRPGQDFRASYSASPQSGGAILDLIHEIDLALWYFGPATLLAAAHRPATCLGLETDGLAELLLRHRDGVLSSVHLNFVQRDYRRCCQIIGESGTIYWDWERGQVEVYGEDGARRETLPHPADYAPNQMYLDEMAHFLRCACAGAPTDNPLAGGRAALELAIAARECAMKGTAA